MASKRYPSDLTDDEWEVLEPHLPAPKKPRQTATTRLRKILDAAFYVLKSGCKWRMLSREVPPSKTVFHYFRVWRLDGTWERPNRTLRRLLREKLGSGSRPSGGRCQRESACT